MLDETGVDTLAGDAGAGREIAVERADDAAGNSPCELPEGRPDGQYRLPLPQGVRVTERDVRGRCSLHPHDGEIAQWIGANEGGIPLLAVGQDHLEPGTPVHDVLVRHDV